MASETPFDPTRHLTRVSGSDYLEVKWRLVWLRDRHPDATLETELVSHHDNTARRRVGGAKPRATFATTSKRPKPRRSAGRWPRWGLAPNSARTMSSAQPMAVSSTPQSSRRAHRGQAHPVSARSLLQLPPSAPTKAPRSASFAICKRWPVRLGSTARPSMSGRCRSSASRPLRSAAAMPRRSSTSFSRSPAGPSWPHKGNVSGG
jgi:hypothetical protein